MIIDFVFAVLVLSALWVIAIAVYSIGGSLDDAADALDRIATAIEDKASEPPPDAIDVHGFAKYLSRSVDGADPEAVAAAMRAGGFENGGKPL